MAEDRYRLAPVRDARERVETVRRGELAHAIGDAAATEAAVAAARTHTESARAKLVAALAIREHVAAAIVRAERYVARCRRDLDGARDAELRVAAAHDAKLGAIDGARAQLVRARADRELIERHFVRWRETQKKLAERRED